MRSYKLIFIITAVFLTLVICTGVFLYSFSGRNYTETVKAECGEDIDYRLVLAVIKAESEFDESAVSNKGAVGLMQLLPSTAEWLWSQNYDSELTEEMLYSPEINIELGIAYLKYLLDRFELEYALAAYNAGEGVVSGWLEDGLSSVDDIPYKETREYVRKVTRYYKIFKSLHK